MNSPQTTAIPNFNDRVSFRPILLQCVEIPSPPNSPPRTSSTVPQFKRNATNRSYKTEMCKSGIKCPFGIKCMFAHKPSELRYVLEPSSFIILNASETHTLLSIRKLSALELHISGKIDLVTYRQTPCFTLVSTGACPFGNRCDGVHDPRFNRPNTTANLKLCKIAKFGSTDSNNLTVDAKYKLQTEEVQGLGLFDTRSGENVEKAIDRIYDCVTNQNEKDLSVVSTSQGVPYWLKLKVAMIHQEYLLRNKRNDELAVYKSNAKFDQLVCCMVGKEKTYFWNEFTMEVSLVPSEARKERITVVEISFGPKSGRDLINRILLFNTPTGVIQYMACASDRFGSVARGNDGLRSILANFDIFILANVCTREEENLLGELMRFALLQTMYDTNHMKMKGDFNLKLESLKVRDRVTNFIAQRKKWSCPKLNYTSTSDYMDAEVPPLDKKYELQAKKKYGLYSIWNNAASIMEEESFRLKLGNENLVLNSKESQKTKQEYRYGEGDADTTLSRSELCWRSILL